MKHILDDGRILVASEKDIIEFFEEHPVVGAKIFTLDCTEKDIMIQNLEVIDNIMNREAECAINTDGAIRFWLSNGEMISIEFSGDGPIVLGTFTREQFEKGEREYNGNCYRLDMLFRFCIDQEITGIELVKKDSKMEFPCYRGIDMSDDDEGIKEIKLKLGNIEYLGIGGSGDFSWFGHFTRNGIHETIHYKELLAQLNDETIDRIFADDPETREAIRTYRSRKPLRDDEGNVIFGSYEGRERNETDLCTQEELDAYVRDWVGFDGEYEKPLDTYARAEDLCIYVDEVSFPDIPKGFTIREFMESYNRQFPQLRKQYPDVFKKKR